MANLSFGLDLKKSKNSGKSAQSGSALISSRKKLKIRVKDPEKPELITDFQALKDRYQVPEELIKKIPFERPTPVQMQAIPLLLEHRNLLCRAPTGSGKTLAYLVPLIANLSNGKGQGLIIIPTRELAQQINRELAQVNVKSLKVIVNEKLKNRKIDILISTPAKLIDFLKKSPDKLNRLSFLVLDECDKLFDFGFAPQLDEILQLLFPYLCDDQYEVVEQCQIAFLSATVSEKIKELANQFMQRPPVELNIGDEGSNNDITQEMVFVGSEEGKLMALRKLRADGKLRPPCLIFCESKGRSKQLFREIAYDGIFVDIMHSDRTPKQRDTCIENFRKGITWVLICSDVMARGIDFVGVRTVINFDLPASRQNYIHRIGRTGRAGEKGLAVTFFTEQDKPYLKSIATLAGEGGTWMTQLKTETRTEAQQFHREHIGTEPVNVHRKRKAKARLQHNLQHNKPAKKAKLEEAV